jgi:hypothetical protein
LVESAVAFISRLRARQGFVATRGRRICSDIVTLT